MMRNTVAILLLASVPGLAAALGLGKIELNSALNQPFNARIQLLSPTAEEIQSLKVGLADSDAFRRAGIDRPFSLSKLKFKIQVNDSGPDYIQVTSDDPIREPFLNFLLEANWSSGRLFREYTVLLDPPMYDPNARRMAPEPVTEARPQPEPEPAREPAGTMEPEPAMTEPQVEEAAEPAMAEPEPEAAAAAPEKPAYAGDEYGPIVRNDTLWSIARETRPGDVSIQQMMLALLRTNPEAFIDNNVNGLKRGYVLRMPDDEAIYRLNQAAALAEVKSQYALWDQARGKMAESTAERPAGTPATPAEETGTAGRDESELRLVTPEQGAGAGQTETGGALGEELALANEQMEALSAENAELKDRLSESEVIIEDLQRLIALKDEELATLQQQLAAREQAEAEAAAQEQAEAAMAGEKAEPKPEPKPEPKARPEPKPAQPEPVPAPAGMVETARTLVMDNLMYVGAGALVLLLALGGMVMLRRRGGGAAAPAEEGTEVGEFPDFSGTEAITELPEGEEDETDFAAGEEQEEPGEGTADESEAATIIAEAPAEEEEEMPAASAAPAAEAEPEPEPAEKGEEEDPLAEVNVFLAYEHFDQAEEFVRDAIEEDPDNLDFHSKLLEVFYAAGDKVKYEEEARVLHDKVGGEGEYWDMAQAMWQEMSPSRALFEEPAEGEEEEAETRAETTGGGIVDLTADVTGEGEDTGLDFDLGMEEGGEEEGDTLTGEETMDFTTKDMEDTLDFSTEGGDEDILDVTAAVGLESGAEEEAGEDEDEDNLLDITGGDSKSEEQSEDLLDISSDGSGSEDLLDVTSHADLEDTGMESDLLDVTSATGAGADSDELLEVDKEFEGDQSGQEEEDSLDFDIGDVDSGAGEEEDKSLDFDMEVSESKDSAKGDVSYHEGDTLDMHEASGSDNVVEFGAGSAEKEEQGEQEGGLELNLESDEEGGDQEEGLSLSLDQEDEDKGGDDSDMEISLDIPGAGESEEEESGGLELSLEEEDSGAPAGSVGKEQDADEEEFSFDLDMEDEDTGSNDVPELEIEDTFEMPKGGGATEDQDTFDLTQGGADEDEEMLKTVEIPGSKGEEKDEDEDDGDTTVFVPRSGNGEEQSVEDEIATKLDLAKAYVELGDKDSAKSILEDIIAEGNDEQRQQAQEMMNQVS